MLDPPAASKIVMVSWQLLKIAFPNTWFSLIWRVSAGCADVTPPPEAISSEMTRMPHDVLNFTIVSKAV
jgi:hypothetical protein